jgi:hypothetical protein
MVGSVSDMRNFLRYWVREHPVFASLLVVMVTLNLAYAYQIFPDRIPDLCVNKSELAAQYRKNGNYKKQLIAYSTEEKPWLGAVCFYEEPETTFSLTHDKEWGKDHLTGELVEFLRHHPDMLNSPLITDPAREAFRRQESKPQ